MLERVRLALKFFCMAIGAKINWHKSVGFLTDPRTTSQWGIFMGFRWIPRGQTTCYLGFQVGLDITPAQQFLPMLDSIQQKLALWCTTRLSLANQARGQSSYFGHSMVRGLVQVLLSLLCGIAQYTS